MRYFLLFTFSLLFFKIKSENSTTNKADNESKSKDNFDKSDSNDTLNNEIYSLSDITFDMVLKKGINYKWLVLLYSDTCYHCAHARREIKEVFEEYKNSTTLKFAEIEINRNPMTYMRFSTEGVPYIFLLQNNTIFELDLYPSKKNLKKFIETDFNDVKDELLPFPPMVSIYRFGWMFIKNLYYGLINSINELLYDYGYEFQVTPLLFILFIFLFISFFCILDWCCLSRICPEIEIKPPINKEKNNETEEQAEEIEENEKDKDNKNIKEKDGQNDNKELTEEEKIAKETEMEKKRQEKDNQDKNLKKNDKKSKKKKE